MRILLCGLNYAPDLIGVSKYTTELCEGLAARGHEMRVITAPPYYPAWKIPPEHQIYFYRREKIAGVEITRVPIYVPQTQSGVKRLLHHASFALTSAPALLNIAWRWRPDILFSIAPSLMSSAMVARAARWSDATSWLHIQDFEVDAAFELGFLADDRLRNAMLAVERTILNAFDYVSTLSPQMMRSLEREAIPLEKIRELRNWVDIRTVMPGDRMTSLRAELGYGENDIVALYAGNMSSKQGLELILDAARALDNDCSAVRFILCGEGPQKSALRTMASGLHNTRFLDLMPNDKFAELLNTADIHLIAQRAETASLVFPSKLGGILASGRPVIAMASPGTDLWTEIDGAGIAVCPGDAGDLADGLRKLSADPALRHRLGMAARRLAEQRWDRTAIIENLERQLIEVRAQARRSA